MKSESCDMQSIDNSILTNQALQVNTDRNCLKKFNNFIDKNYLKKGYNLL